MQRIDWTRYAEIAYVNFGWSPDQFWHATPTDFWISYEGWSKLTGGAGKITPLKRCELNDLVSRHRKS